MKLAALQPSYLPWLGHLEQIMCADKFLILENLQFSSNSWVNRNRILNNQTVQWLTIPVIKNGFQAINEVMIDNSKNWKRKHISSIQNSYEQHEISKRLIELIADNNYITLLDYLKSINDFIYPLFNLQNKVEYKKLDKINQDKNQRLIDLCLEYGANTYLTGQSANSYIDLKLFESKGINVIFQDYIPKPYKQNSKDFKPYLSIIDCLLNGYEPNLIIENKFFNKSNSLYI